MNVAPSDNTPGKTNQTHQTTKATQRPARLRTDTAAWSDISPGNIDHLMLVIFKTIQADIAQRRYGLEQVKKTT